MNFQQSILYEKAIDGTRTYWDKYQEWILVVNFVAVSNRCAERNFRCRVQRHFSLSIVGS